MNVSLSRQYLEYEADMTKTVWFLIFCALTLILCAALIMNALPEILDRSRPTPEPRDPLGPPSAGYREIEIPRTPPAEPTRPASPEAVPVAIAGRVVGPDLAPLTGDVELEFGPETVRPQGGRFDIEAVERSGPVELTLRRTGRVLERWAGAVVDETPVPELAYAVGALGFEELVVRPTSIRWSITLTSRAAVEGRTAPPNARDEGAREDSQRDPRGETDETASPNQAAPALPDGQFLEIDSVLVEEWGPSGAVHVRGRAALPDGLHVCVTMFFRGSRIVSAPGCPTVRAGRFESSFLLPEGFRFFSDVYEVHASFSPAQEELRFMLETRERYPEIPWDDLEELEIARRIFIGFPEEKRSDDLAAERYIESTLDRITLLRRVFAKRLDDTMKLAKGWDPALLESVRSARQGWLSTASVGSQGEFLEGDWRAFVDEWRSLAREMVEHEAARQDAKYQLARNSLERLLKSVYQLSFVESRMLYGLFGQRTHPKDIYDLADGLDGSRTLLLKMVQEHVKILVPYRDIASE